MQETRFSFSNLESHPAGAVLAPGRHIIGGWVMPRAGGHFVDVRARVDGRAFPGVHGFPRADLAAHFQTGRPQAFAGFKVTVELASGPVEIVLEVLTIEGRWAEFQRIRLQVDGTLPPGDVWVPRSPLRWHDFCRGLDLVLRERRRRPMESWPALAGHFAGQLPHPRELLTPERPFVGFIDEPSLVYCQRFGRIPLLGYVFDTAVGLRRVLASSDLQVLQPLEYGRPMPALAGHYPGQPAALTSGYFGLIDIPSQLPNPVPIRIYAERTDGSLHLVHALRSRLHDAEEEKPLYAAHAPSAFDEALAAWKQALAGREIPVVEDRDFQPGVDRLRASYAQRTRRLPPATPHRPAGPFASTPAIPGQVLFVTHNLNREGAPLFLLDLARQLPAAGAKLTVLSPSEGALRADFASTGAQVRLIDTSQFLAAQTTDEARKTLQAIGRGFDFSPYGIVVCNTLTTFWAVHAAKAAGRRVLFYSHESTPPAAFYGDRLAPAVIRLAEEAFGLADQVSCTTAATSRYHADFCPAGNLGVTPGWIDVTRLDAWRAQNPRAALRDRFGLKPDGLLVTNVGTVSDRKGQHTFVRAADLFCRRYPALAARTRFILLGGRNSAFDSMLGEVLAALDRPNITVHAETADYLPYYAAADLTVCSSYEESSPRVVLETMALEIPLLASAVHGVPELARPDLEATLLPPGDTAAWCEGMARLLLSPAIGRDLAARARARVVSGFAAPQVLPRHLVLIARVAGGA